jgi:hypothetical protein
LCWEDSTTKRRYDFLPAIDVGAPMKAKFFAIAAALLVLSGCGSMTIPAAARMGNDEVLIGTSTASIRGGTFEVSSPSKNLVCKGNYDALDTNIVISAPVRCSDGRYGTITVTRTPDLMAGQGVFTLADGTTGNVAFGRLAATVINQPRPPEYAALATTPGLIATSPTTRTPACESPNYYGSISCLTGRPRTTYVRGYYRKNGTYVRPYYRSN